MALIKCPECQTEVSDKADKCPKCASPLKYVDPLEKITSKLGLIIGIPYIIIFGLFSFENKNNFAIDVVLFVLLLILVIINYLPKSFKRGYICLVLSLTYFSIVFSRTPMIAFNEKPGEQFLRLFPSLIFLVLGFLYLKIEKNHAKNSEQI
jgi:K+-sensing histidine kinase KdpD